MRVFLDANVLFTAAHNPDGKAALIIELAVQGYWALFSSPFALEEARRNLEKKFPQRLDSLKNLQAHIQLVDHHPGVDFPEGLARKDQPIFQAALACHADYLLTGDLKDFGPHMNRPDNTFGICIQTVGEFLSLSIPSS